MPATIAFDPLTYTVNESDGTATLTIKMTQSNARDVFLIRAQTLDGSAKVVDGDYQALNQLLVFNKDNKEQTVTVNILDEGEGEGDETFAVKLVDAGSLIAPTLGGNATVTIQDTGLKVLLAINDNSLSPEETDTATLTASLADGALAPAGGVTVNLAFSGDAVFGTDYTTPGNATAIVIPQGSNSATLVISSQADTTDEDDEDIVVDISSVVNAVELNQQTVTTTIVDNDNAPSVFFDLASSNGDEAVANPVIEVKLSAVSGKTVTVNLSDITPAGQPVSPGDYSLSSTTITFDPGQTVKNVPLVIVDDQGIEPAETIQLRLSSATNAVIDNAKRDHDYTINDNDNVNKVTFSLAASSGAELAVPVQVTLQVDLIRIAGNVDNVTVDFEVVIDNPADTNRATQGAGNDFVIAAGPLNFGAGNGPLQIVIDINDDALSEPSETIRIRLKNPVGAALGAITEHVVTIADNDVNTAPVITPIADRVDNESGSQLVIPVSVTDPDVANGQSLTFTLDAAPPGMTIVKTGPTAAEIRFTPTDDLAQTTVTVRVTDNGSPNQFATDSFLFRVDNVPPQNVDAGPDQTVFEGDLVNLSGTFNDPGTGDTHTLTWDVVASNGEVIPSGSGASFSFTPGDDGTYSVTFTVADDDGGTTTDTVVITVNNKAPVVSLGGDVTIQPGGTLNVGGFFTDVAADANWTGTVDFGDGLGAQPLTLDQLAKTFTLNKTYAGSTAGQSFTVVVSITDNDGDTGTDTLIVTVGNVAVQGCLTNGDFEAAGSAIASWAVNGDGSQQTTLGGVVNPTQGAQFGLITSAGNAGTGGFTGPSGQLGTAGTVLSQTFRIGAGQTLSFDFRFLTNEGTGAFFNDFALGQLLDSSGNVVTTLFSVDTFSATLDASGTGFFVMSGPQSASFQITVTGEYTLQFVVSDAIDTVVDSALVIDNIQLSNLPPVLSIGGSASVGEGAQFTRAGFFVDPPRCDSWTLTADFGDGTGAQPVNFTPDGGDLDRNNFNLSHTYLNEGTFTVTVTVTDEFGASDTETFQVTVVNVDIVVTATDAGTIGRIRVFDASSGLEKFTIQPFGNFVGGVRVATGDVNGDGRPDIIAAQGPSGNAQVRVFDGTTGAPLPGILGAFHPFGATFRVGVFVAAGDLNNDGRADIVAATDAGAVARVKVFSGLTGASLPGFPATGILPFGSFTGGVRVAVGDIDGNGQLDIVTARGSGSTPQIRVFRGNNGLVFGNRLGSFLAYGIGFRGGVYVAAGDINNDGFDDIITAPGNGSSLPIVNVFKGAVYPAGALPGPTKLASFQAYPTSFPGGVRVASTDVDNDGVADIITSPGSIGGLTEVRSFKASLNPDNTIASIQQIDQFFAFFPNFQAGVFVAGNVRKRK